MRTLTVEVHPSLREHREAASSRLQYLFPALRFSIEGTGFAIDGLGDAGEEDGVRREVAHALYRERVYSDTLPMRTALLETLTRK